MSVTKNDVTQPQPGQQWYSVETAFVHKVTFHVCAENKEQAEQIVKEQCGMPSAEIYTNIPFGQVEWLFPAPPETEIGEVKQIEK